MPKLIKWSLITLVGLFALIGLVFTSVFVAMQFDLLNVRGTIDERNTFFFSAFLNPTADVGTSSTPGVVAEPEILAQPCVAEGATVCAWNETPEWLVVKGGLEKDAALINRVAQETGVSARLIAAVVVPEQIRFFTAEREVFKRYFEPLKILGSLSKFSLGVSGIKQETAELIEDYANDSQSPFYPGEGFAQMLAYPEGVDEADLLFQRLTDEKDHYYSYLYTGLFLREIEMQWQRAGFDLRNQPAIASTIFNLGFKASSPKSNPIVGGATIVVGGQRYSFGDLSGRFYSSQELRAVFPE